MTERENLPVVIVAQELAATTEKRGSLVARGMVAVLANKRQMLTRSNDALYRQAREVYNRLTDDGLGAWFGYKEREIPLTEAFNSFQQLATEGYGKAYFPLSTLYGGEQSVKGNIVQAECFRKLAFDWLYASQLQNDPEIWHDLAVLYCFDDEIDLAIFWFNKAADAGLASSMWALTGVYEDREDWETSLFWQIKAAEAGHEKAQHGLEQQHEHGDLAEKIGDKQVFDWYVWSAEQGDLWAQLFLAEAYRFGDVIEQDVDESTFWFRKAAMQGSSIGQWRLGEMYILALGVVRDDEQAVYWLNKAVEQKLASGQNRLGWVYEVGWGVPQDYKVAMKWYRLSADQGNCDAQNNIGLMYYNGRGVEKNNEQAVHWFRMAADQGHEGAQTRLGNLGIDWKAL